MPPLYAHEDGDTKPKDNGFIFQHATISSCDPEIDEVSPDEDDRATKAVLHLPG